MTTLKHPILEFRDDYAFLSNFYPAPFEWKGIQWRTSEHAYQASKSFDLEEAQRIAALATPAKAKQAGKRIKNFRSNWNEVRIKVMEEVVCAKFQQNLDLLTQLLDTYPAHLEEGNWWNDTFWGVSPVGSGKGQNELGKVLMRLRDECVHRTV